MEWELETGMSNDMPFWSGVPVRAGARIGAVSRRQALVILLIAFTGNARVAVGQTLSTSAKRSGAPIIAAGAHLRKLAGGFKFTEGPASDSKGNVYFTDQPNDRILKWSTRDKLSTFLQPCGRSNGLCFDSHGNLWACADGKNELWRIDRAGKPTVVVKKYGGKLLNGPNDVWLRPDGGLYFTDPFYKRDYWKRGPTEQDHEAVYYLTPDRKTLSRVVADLVQPNGIIGTADGTLLYVADIKANKTYAYDIQPDGTLKNKRLFCKLGSDGMTIDNRGDLYLTGNGVTVFDKTGRQILKIPVHEAWTANVCFGGKDRRTLFITASKGLYSMRMRVKGVGSQ
jgi:gluconolactonase